MALVESQPRLGTDALAASVSGDLVAQEHLIGLIYEDLRALAAKHLRGERVDHTLQPTALAHEALLRLIDIDQIDWKEKSHFFAMAATSLRRVLVDHARAKAAKKRGGDAKRERLTGADTSFWEDQLQVLALDMALHDLEKTNPRQVRVVELRFFSGLSVEETAAALDISKDTVKADWRFARAWLNHELTKGESGDD